MSSKDRILAVDDDPINLCILEEILGGEYELQTRADGTDFLDTARRFNPDLILLDVMMPGVSGYDLCRQARAEPRLSNVKIIMVSSKQRLAERMTGYDAGADDYVTKPFDTDEFLAKIKVYLRLKSVEEIDQLKGSILTLLNHETRTPLTGILAPAELLLADRKMKGEDQLELLGSILENGKRLQRLVEKTAWLGSKRGEMRAAQAAPVDISRTLADSMERIGQEHPDRLADLHVDSLESVILDGDEAALSMVIGTLLENAIRFSETGDRVEVALAVDLDRVLLSVTDHGKGIEDQFLPRVFDGFVVGDLSHHEGGHGISLAISQGIVEDLGGEMTVTSEPGVATRFVVSLPLDRMEEAA